MTLIPVRARGTFGNIDGTHTHKVEIRQNGYSGSVLTLTLGDGADAVRLDYLGGDEEAYDPVKGSRFSFSFKVREREEKELLADIENSSLGEFAMTWKVDDVIQWRGFIYPEQVNKPVRYNGLASIQAGDGLALLDLTDDNPSELSVKGVIELMLRDNNNDRSGLYFNRLYDNGDEVFRCNLAWQDQRFSGYYNSFIRSMTHRQDINNSAEFLRKILVKLCLRIYQGEGGVYWIEHIPEKYRDSSTWMRYNYDTGLAVGTTEELGEVTLTDNIELDKVYSGLSSYRVQPEHSKTVFLLISQSPFDTWYFYPSSSIYNSSVEQVEVGAVYSHNSSNYEVLLISGNLADYYQANFEFSAGRTRGTRIVRQAGPVPAGLNGSLWLRRTTGTNAPEDTGTLTRVSGTGPTTITFSRTEVATTTVTDDLSVDNPNDSFYVKPLPFDSLLSYIPAASIANSNDFTYMEVGGFLTITDFLVTPPQEFGTWFRKSAVGEYDRVSHGQFDEAGDGANWTGYSATAVTSGNGLIRITASAATSSPQGAYIDMALENGEDYFLTAELFQANPNADTLSWRIGVSSTTTPPISGFTLFTEQDKEYLSNEFTASAATMYLHIWDENSASAGNYVDMANVRVVKKSDMQKAEQLGVEEVNNHFRIARKLYGLGFRGNNYFNERFKFADSLLIPHSMTIVPRRKEISGSFIEIANDDYVFWSTILDDTLPSKILNNGESDNSIAWNGTDQYLVSQQQILGGYFELSFFPTPTGLSNTDTIVSIGFENIATGMGLPKSLDHSWYLEEIVDVGVGTDRYISVYEGGEQYNEAFEFDENDEFKIIFDGVRMDYYVNNTLKYTSYPDPAFTLNIRAFLQDGAGFGLQKIRLRGQVMKYPYAE